MNQIETMVAEMNAFSDEVWFNKMIPDFKSRFDEEHVKNLIDSNISRYSYGIDKGRRFSRVFKYDYGRPESGRSVVWFVDMTTGKIYKANGWKAASKYVRGHVDNWRDAMCQASSQGIYGFISCK